MKECHRWLNCDDMDGIIVKELIGLGAVKAVYRAVWAAMNITYSILNNPNFIDDFQSGLEMLKLLNPSPYVTQLIGFCPSENVIWTEYHPLGNAVNIVDKIHKTGFRDNVHVRLKLCLNYALLLEYLHSGPAGCRVMCDSNTLEKTLSQLLVTNELSLLLNDVDALPEINSEQKTIRCGNRNLSGNFIAPEQRASDPHVLEGYNEKTDIWKAASVCEYFISDVSNSEIIRYKLFFLHKKCKSVDVNERPSATQLAAQYIKIMHELDDEL
ncbi:hypothetical protein R5R35_007387 [Gryllus longicercus]|uniref:Uncharacterized protein n=1 Tax=Gryllus longicercus TaxID=2509291 RepID=A0AAN9V918_9ORTH